VGPDGRPIIAGIVIGLILAGVIALIVRASIRAQLKRADRSRVLLQPVIVEDLGIGVLSGLGFCAIVALCVMLPESFEDWVTQMLREQQFAFWTICALVLLLLYRALLPWDRLRALRGVLVEMSPVDIRAGGRGECWITLPKNAHPDSISVSVQCREIGHVDGYRGGSTKTRFSLVAPVEPAPDDQGSIPWHGTFTLPRDMEPSGTEYVWWVSGRCRRDYSLEVRVTGWPRFREWFLFNVLPGGLRPVLPLDEEAIELGIRPEGLEDVPQVSAIESEIRS